MALDAWRAVALLHGIKAQFFPIYHSFSLAAMVMQACRCHARSMAVAVYLWSFGGKAAQRNRKMMSGAVSYR
jgi:hypothetical protein